MKRRGIKRGEKKGVKGDKTRVSLTKETIYNHNQETLAATNSKRFGNPTRMCAGTA
jgi:hypothetical protein